MGKAKPLSMKKGRMEKQVVIMASCCVAEMVEGTYTISYRKYTM
jgi:hypothetical protein